MKKILLAVALCVCVATPGAATLGPPTLAGETCTKYNQSIVVEQYTLQLSLLESAVRLLAGLVLHDPMRLRNAIVELIYFEAALAQMQIDGPDAPSKDCAA